YVSVVISPATTTSPVVIRVSQATRPLGSSARTTSSTESEIWSAILSGCPSVTDSELNWNVRDIPRRLADAEGALENHAAAVGLRVHRQRVDRGERVHELLDARRLRAGARRRVRNRVQERRQALDVDVGKTRRRVGEADITRGLLEPIR